VTVLPAFTGEGPTELETLHLVHAKFAQTAARAAKGLDI
jgi:hypothetical protein